MASLTTSMCWNHDCHASALHKHNSYATAKMFHCTWTCLLPASLKRLQRVSSAVPWCAFKIARIRSSQRLPLYPVMPAWIAVISSGLVTCDTYVVAATEVAVHVGKHLRSRRMPWQTLRHVLNQRGFRNRIGVPVLQRSTLTLQWGSVKHPKRASQKPLCRSESTSKFPR